MVRVAFINKFGDSEVHEMNYMPRVGEVVPLFYKPFPHVTQVACLPEKIMPELEGKNIDALITVS